MIKFDSFLRFLSLLKDGVEIDHCFIFLTYNDE